MNIKPGDLVELKSDIRRYDTKMKVTIFKTGQVGVVMECYEHSDGINGVDVMLPHGIMNTIERQVRKIE